MRFLWDPIKASSNFKKHGVSFQEAVSVFIDQNALRLFDADHSHSEHRWILLGLSTSLKLLVVVHIEIDDDILRIISARKASRSESKTYMTRR